MLDALDLEGDRDADVTAEASDEPFELSDAGKRVAAQRADGTTGIGQPVPDEAAGPLDRLGDLLPGLLALGQNARPL